MTRPAHLHARYGAQFEDECVAAAYRFRLPYPRALVARLREVVSSPGPWLEVGCGTGELTRRLAADGLAIDALDPSPAMLRVARASEGGANPSIRWMEASAERAPLKGPYAAVLAAESLHWIDADVALPLVHDALAPPRRLVVAWRVAEPPPWLDELLPLIRAFSTNREYDPAYDLEADLARRALVEWDGSETIASEEHHVPVADHVESIHSRNGFSRQRMGEASASAFDARASAILKSHAAEDGTLTMRQGARLAWGRITPRQK